MNGVAGIDDWRECIGTVRVWSLGWRENGGFCHGLRTRTRGGTGRSGVEKSSSNGGRSRGPRSAVGDMSGASGRAGRAVSDADGAVQAGYVSPLRDKSDRDLARFTASHQGRQWNAHYGLTTLLCRLTPFRDCANLLAVKVLPRLDDASRCWLGEDQSLGARGGELSQGGLVAVVALVLRDDDEIGFR